MVKDKIKFFEDKAREKESVITYAKKPVSIADMRHGELDKTTATRFTPDSSFQNLFNERLKHIPGKRENVQITINANVKYTIGNKSTITQKTYGPFRMAVRKIDTDVMYKYMIYTLLQNNLSILSTQTIANVGAKITTHNEQFFKHHKAGALKLSTFFLDKQFPIKQRGDNTSMVDSYGIIVRIREGSKHILIRS